MPLQDELGLTHPIENSSHALVLAIMLTGQQLAKEGDRLLRKHGLTDSQFNVLMLLKYQAEAEGMSQTRLGKMLLVNRSNVTGLVDRMEAAGWVERNAEAGDRRVKRIRLTASGARLIDRAEKTYFERVKETMGWIKPAEANALNKLLDGIRARLRRDG